MAARLEESPMVVARLTPAVLVGEHPIRVAPAVVALPTSMPRRIRPGTPAVAVLRRAVVVIRAERPGLRRTTVVVASTSPRGIIAEARREVIAKASGKTIA
jgi:hypothetical protein